VKFIQENQQNRFVMDFIIFSDTCHFQKLSTEPDTNNLDIHWTTTADSLVCAFPYILAFGEDSIEIRLIVNGNLVEACVYPKLKFITSKRDIYYATTAPEFNYPRGDHFVRWDRRDSSNVTSRDNSVSPPISPGLGT
jgi:hypothetical protein